VRYGGRVSDTRSGPDMALPLQPPDPAVRGPLRGCHAGAHQTAWLGESDRGRPVAGARPGERLRSAEGSQLSGPCLAHLPTAAQSPLRTTSTSGQAAPGWGQYGSVGDRYRIPGGWTVEVLQLAVGERLRVRHYGYYIADATAHRSPDAA